MKKQVQLCAGWNDVECVEPVQPGRRWCPEHEKVRIDYITKQLEDIRDSFNSGEVKNETTEG